MGVPLPVCAASASVADGVPDPDPEAAGVVAASALTDGPADAVADTEAVEDDACPAVTLAEGVLVGVNVLELLRDAPDERVATAVDDPEVDGTDVTDAGAVLDGLLTGDGDDAPDDDGVAVGVAVSAPLGVDEGVAGGVDEPVGVVVPVELGETP